MIDFSLINRIAKFNFLYEKTLSFKSLSSPYQVRTE